MVYRSVHESLNLGLDLCRKDVMVGLCRYHAEVSCSQSVSLYGTFVAAFVLIVNGLMNLRNRVNPKSREITPFTTKQRVYNMEPENGRSLEVLLVGRVVNVPPRALFRFTFDGFPSKIADP